MEDSLFPPSKDHLVDLGTSTEGVDPPQEAAVLSVLLSPNVAVETPGTSLGEISAEELEERRRRKGKEIPSKVLDVSDSDKDGIEHLLGLSLSHSSMNFSSFGILDFIDEWLRDDEVKELQRNFCGGSSSD